jgi:hypothetical protein
MRKDSQRAESLITGLRDTAMKTFRIKDGTGRVRIIYEAYTLDEDADQECIATVYGYDDATAQPAYTYEKKAKWNPQWDIDAQAQATTDGFWLVEGES